MATDVWIWRSERAIPSDLTAARKALDEVLGELRTHRWDPRDVFAVHLAVHEALTNAIFHGNDSMADKQVHVACRLSKDRVQVIITDEGKGFDPADVPNPTDPEYVGVPGGRGVLLMKAFMSRVDFNRRGNRVVLEKVREKST